MRPSTERPSLRARPRAVVTGAARRVGRQIALTLARSGFDLAVHFHGSDTDAEETAAACRAAGADAWTVEADLGTVAGCDALVSAVKARWDALHVLVNNASVFDAVPFEEISAEEWDRVLAINLRAPFLLSRGLLPLLRAADARPLGAPEGQHGVVVHLCDIGGERPVKGHTHYSVSKAGIAMLVKAMAVELAPAVRSVGVAPGQVAWPESYSAEKRAAITRRIPMGRPGSPTDVAVLVRFLATEAHYLNGVVVPVDGGLAVRY
jgi:pteridine reductase